MKAFLIVIHRAIFNLVVAISIFLQNLLFPHRNFGHVSSKTLTLCGRVWIEDIQWAERLLDRIFGKDHCMNGWIKWSKDNNIFRLNPILMPEAGQVL